MAVNPKSFFHALENIAAAFDYVDTSASPLMSFGRQRTGTEKRAQLVSVATKNLMNAFYGVQAYSSRTLDAYNIVRENEESLNNEDFNSPFVVLLEKMFGVPQAQNSSSTSENPAIAQIKSHLRKYDRARQDWLRDPTALPFSEWLASHQSQYLGISPDFDPNSIGSKMEMFRKAAEGVQQGGVFLDGVSKDAQNAAALFRTLNGTFGSSKLNSSDPEAAFAITAAGIFLTQSTAQTPKETLTQQQRLMYASGSLKGYNRVEEFKLAYALYNKAILRHQREVLGQRQDIEDFIDTHPDAIAPQRPALKDPLGGMNNIIEFRRAGKYASISASAASVLPIKRMASAVQRATNQDARECIDKEWKLAQASYDNYQRVMSAEKRLETVSKQMTAAEIEIAMRELSQPKPGEAEYAYLKASEINYKIDFKAENLEKETERALAYINPYERRTLLLSVDNMIRQEGLTETTGLSKDQITVLRAKIIDGHLRHYMRKGVDLAVKTSGASKGTPIQAEVNPLRLIRHANLPLDIVELLTGHGKLDKHNVWLMNPQNIYYEGSIALGMTHQTIARRYVEANYAEKNDRHLHTMATRVLNSDWFVLRPIRSVLNVFSNIPILGWPLKVIVTDRETVRMNAPPIAAASAMYIYASESMELSRGREVFRFAPPWAQRLANFVGAILPAGLRLHDFTGRQERNELAGTTYLMNTVLTAFRELAIHTSPGANSRNPQTSALSAADLTRYLYDIMAIGPEYVSQLFGKSQVPKAVSRKFSEGLKAATGVDEGFAPKNFETVHDIFTTLNSWSRSFFYEHQRTLYDYIGSLDPMNKQINLWKLLGSNINSHSDLHNINPPDVNNINAKFKEKAIKDVQYAKDQGLVIYGIAENGFVVINGKGEKEIRFFDPETQHHADFVTAEAIAGRWNSLSSYMNTLQGNASCFTRIMSSGTQLAKGVKEYGAGALAVPSEITQTPFNSQGQLQNCLKIVGSILNPILGWFIGANNNFVGSQSHADDNKLAVNPDLKCVSIENNTGEVLGNDGVLSHVRHRKPHQTQIGRAMAENTINRFGRMDPTGSALLQRMRENEMALGG